MKTHDQPEIAKRSRSPHLIIRLEETQIVAKQPKNHGKDWSAGDMKQLLQLARENTPTRVAALKLGRTPAAVQQKASSEGISLRPNNQRPYGTRKK